MADDGSHERPPGAARPGQAGLRGRDLVGLGGLLVGAVVVGLVVGYLIDRAAGTDPAFTLVGILLGIVAGGAGFAARVRAALRE